ncbi:hypothetical protein GRS48_01300 [Halorubrum sp. JWXQ-INN 858]|uniref:hypothetical protein n=1 Tax=Halorubrum sp. JWXQ-INN 858 TaxID=2690782 RepID=UPI0013586202|nr:hypothetical protein [Halorubrum sp. JWXQ-INN 858]MWV63467.1 hypothetical protein [Halorubrum sp. JWXQ-INN 858]
MGSMSENVRQLAPHWAVMFVTMFALLALIENVYGGLAFWQSLLLVLVVAFGYPFLARALGVAPEIWQRQ